MTDNPDQVWAAEARRQGASIIQADFERPETIVAHRFWRRINRLYLLSPDPSTNLLRLSVISQRLAPIFKRRRVPLIVRIDDPWLAEAWRAQQFGQHASGSDHLWAADTTSKYEVTARRLLDQILDNKAVRRLIVCGTSQLTLALCAEMALRHTERRFHTAQGQPELPELTLVHPTLMNMRVITRRVTRGTDRPATRRSSTRSPPFPPPRNSAASLRATTPPRR